MIDQLRILIIDDEPNIRSGLTKGLRSPGRVIDAAETAAEGLKRFDALSHDIVITDMRLPGDIDGLSVVRHVHQRRPEAVVIVVTAFGTVEAAVEAMRCGAYDFVTKPVDLNVIRHQVAKAEERRKLIQENLALRRRLAEMDHAGELPEIVGNCAATQDVLRQVRQVAGTDATVLLLGESGTGKELTARAIHTLSGRNDQPFVTANLGALPDTLVESELFGHEKGAFTGADRRKLGLLESAGRGTLFLDEITETTAKTQVDLLRVLEQREFHRLGGRDAVGFSARLISATNREMAPLIASGEFREDLYYRLNVVPIRLPPLRERRDDIPLLVRHFLSALSARHAVPGKSMSPEAMSRLMRYPWPGNIRQLRNLLERLTVTVEEEVLSPSHLPLEDTPLSEPSCSLAEAVENAERRAIQAALQACDCHREKTAQRLNISVRTLHYKMSKYGLQ